MNKTTNFSFIRKASTFRVLEELRSHLGYENAIQINQTTIGKRLDMKPQQVWAALKELIGFNIVLKTEQDGVKLYQMNPDFMWRGSAHSFDQAVGRDMKANR